MTWLALTLSVYAALMLYQVSWRVIELIADRVRAEPDESAGEQVAQAFLEQQAQASHDQAVERLRREGEEAMLKSAKPLLWCGADGDAPWWPYEGKHASPTDDTAAIPQVDA